jgi:hypothetical protein
MNIKHVFAFAVFVVLTIVLTTTRPASALPSADKSIAFGEGEFTFVNVFPGHTEPIAFSFTATENKNGNGKGRAIFEYRRTGTRVEVKLNCVSITDSEAVMSGRVQHSDNPDFPKGVDVIFAAVDGSRVPVPFFRDRITPIFTFPDEFDCTGGGPLTILLLESGDIVVQP